MAGTFRRRVNPKLIIESGADSGLFMGIVTGIERVTGVYGESIRFKGSHILQIEGQEPIRARACFLPRLAEDMLVEACESQQIAAESGADPETGAIDDWHLRYALRISKRASEGTPTGYEWDVEPVLEAERAEADPLAQLQAEIAALLPAKAKGK